MNLTLVTRLLFLLLIATSASYAQSDLVQNENSVDSLNITSKEKAVILTVGFYKPFTTENSFIGQGTTGQAGFDLGMQVFLYKNFFIGGFGGYFFLDVTDADLVGDYSRSRVFSASLEVGYELPIHKNIDLGLSIALLGYASYRNFISEGRTRQQRDGASSRLYRAYLSYQFAKHFAFFVNYAFRNDNSSIETAPEIQDNFNKIQYHNVGFGLKFTLFK
ncbi:MAG: hypothetical protein AB8B52_01030 [Winogradskyella sp.]|uniref:hypothetical protein n=1 Tax=Winogradskyella sp. TaxID=1883156 RepID=UPI0038598ECD